VETFLAGSPTSVFGHQWPFITLTLQGPHWLESSRLRIALLIFA
jgi:hypothetical protein